jgi:hypothetical protein
MRPLAAALALSVLTETVVAPKSFWKDLFNEPYTRWSVVFDIGRRESHYRTLKSFETKRISLGNFDCSCEIPIEMVDANARREGDVGEDFTPDDHDINVDAFLPFCDKYGIDVEKEGIVELVRFFEAFECAP